MNADAQSNVAYCRIMACACGTGEESWEVGLKKKFMLAGISMRLWRKKGVVSGSEGMSGMLLEGELRCC